jgi:hypothetical protein
MKQYNNNTGYEYCPSFQEVFAEVEQQLASEKKSEN